MDRQHLSRCYGGLCVLIRSEVSHVEHHRRGETELCITNKKYTSKFDQQAIQIARDSNRFH